LTLSAIDIIKTVYQRNFTKKNIVGNGNLLRYGKINKNIAYRIELLKFEPLYSIYFVEYNEDLKKGIIRTDLNKEYRSYEYILKHIEKLIYEDKIEK
jgi:hypothetical protein